MEIKTIRELMVENPTTTYDYKKWVALDDLNDLIDNSDCFGSPRARAEFNKLVNSQSNDNGKEDKNAK